MKGYGDLPKVTQLMSVRGQRVGSSPGSLAAEHRPLNLLTKKGLYDNTLGPTVLTSGMLQAGEDMEAVRTGGEEGFDQHFQKETETGWH